MFPSRVPGTYLRFAPLERDEESFGGARSINIAPLRAGNVGWKNLVKKENKKFENTGIRT